MTNVEWQTMAWRKGVSSAVSHVWRQAWGRWLALAACCALLTLLPFPARAETLGEDLGLVSYAITYELGGGTVAGTNPDSYSSDGPEVTLVNPTRPNYDFLGWSGTGLVGRANTSVTIPVGSSGNRSYTAHWVPTFYNLSCRLGGGTDRGNPEVFTVETPTFSLVAPERDGYSFAGWSGTGLTGASNLDVTIPQGTVGDRSYAAHWAIVPYSITYDLAGGEVLGNPTTYNVEMASFTLLEPERAGYDFVGWSGTGLDGDRNRGVVVPRGSFGDRSYLAHWESSAYVVRYNVNAGSDRTAAVSPAQEAKGYETVLGELPMPTWPGHTFLGWFTRAEGGEEVTSETLVLAPDTTYYAHWSADPHTVSFDAGGDGAVVGQAVVSGRCGDALEPPSAEREGYAFVGWYTASTGGTRVTDWRIPPEDLTYHARWWAYGVTDFGYAAAREIFTAPVNGTYRLEAWGAQGGYRSNRAMGGRGGYATGVVSLAKGETLYVYVGGSGQKFGWNGGGARAGRSSGGGATDFRLGSTSLYARMLVAGGGGSDGAADRAGGAGGGLAGVDGTGENGTGGQGATQANAGPGDPTGSGVTVAAFGQGGAAVQGNGGVGGAGGGGWYGGGGVYPDASLDNDRGGGGGSGYVWTAGTAQVYPSGCLLDAGCQLSDASTIAGDMPFPSVSGGTETGHLGDGHARVSLIAYTSSSIVVYDANGGTLDGAQESERMVYVSSGETLGELPTPQWDGHFFVGWYSDVVGGSRIAGSVIPAENVTYYAHWSQIGAGDGQADGHHTLVLDAQGGTVSGQGSLTLRLAAGDTLDELPLPARPEDSAGSYLFTGWYTQATGGDRVRAVSLESDTIYYAHWARLTAAGTSQAGHHALVLVANAEGATIAGAASATLLVADGDTLDELPKPERDTYLFIGWYTRATGGGKVKSVTPSDGAVYYAHWSLVATEGFSFARVGREVGTFTAPISGIYLLEAWGADGGSMLDVSTFPAVSGGKGGYSRGLVTLGKGDHLYVTVGEAGYFYDHFSYHDGTWNGGGAVSTHTTNNWHRALGGGATHIATEVIGDGQLLNYVDSKDRVVLVAGGGGGAAGSLYAGKTTDGGAGGGMTGATATYNNGDYHYHAYGGEQGRGGSGDDSTGSFGRGAGSQRGSGGGGWYGGGASALAGGGGSGRVGGLSCAFAANGTSATGTFSYGDETREIEGASWQGDLAGVPERPAEAGRDHSDEAGSGFGADGYARVMLVTPSEGRAVTLDAQGGAVEGSAAITLLVDAGEVFGDLPDATREGYEFAGWYTDSEGGARVTADASTESGEATYYARWSNAVYATHSVTVSTSGTGFSAVSPASATGRLGEVVEISVGLLPGYDSMRVRSNGTTVPLERRADGSWTYLYTIGDDDADLELTVEPITYSITYDLDADAVNDLDNPTSYTVESSAIAFGDATLEGCTFLGWYTSGGTKVTGIAAGSTGDLALHAYFDVNLYGLHPPIPYGQEGCTDGVASVSMGGVAVDGASGARVTAGKPVTITVKAQVGWRVVAWTAHDAGGTMLEAPAFSGAEGASGAAATATISAMPTSDVWVGVVMERASIPQAVAVRWQMPDGTWSTDPGGGSAGVVSSDAQRGDPSAYVAYSTADVWYGETFVPSVSATAVYQAASAAPYAVTEARTTYLDIPRKVADVSFRYRLQAADGTYGPWTDGHVEHGVRVGATALWSPLDEGLDERIYGRVSGSATVGAASAADAAPSSPTVDVTVDRRTYTLTVAHDGHFLGVTGGGTYRAGQEGIAVSATPNAGRYFVYWDGDAGPMSADGTVGGLDDPDSAAATYTMGAADAVIVATSRGVRYTVAIDAAGGEAAFATYAASYDETFEVPDPVLRGHTLASWDISGMDAGEHVLYDDNGTPTVTSAMSLEGVTARSFRNLRTTPGTVVSFLAHWVPATYAVAFDGNGADTGSMPTEGRTYGTAAMLPANGYARQYYSFAGWATSEVRAADGIVDYADGEEVAELCDDPAPDGSTVVTLWAVWKEVTREVGLLTGGGTLPSLGGLTSWSGELWEGAPPPAAAWGHRRLVGWAGASGAVVGLPGETLADTLSRLRGER